MKHIVLLALAFGFNNYEPSPKPPNWDFNAQLAAYFAAETREITAATKTELTEIKDWDAFRQIAREELQDMLGLLPLPEKTPLQARITGRVEHDEFTVENIHFQSLPGLYVTGNLYIPKVAKADLPAILYVCGHATVKKDGYNYGAKVNYQHHPAWFARHGYVCLILDTVQLGEIEGVHHGLYSHNRWWWISRGYTPAGVEAWNGIRAIDYLQSRPEVDGNRIGVTGRSGGGATSWWVAALDDRVKVAVPVAGITDLEDHVLNGCVEGHCDCMYIANYHRWDYSKIAALIAPRPLLLSNTDRDPIFPIGGVFRIYQQVRQVYEQVGAADQFALHTTAGPHQDVQELRVHAFRWFDRHLYDRDMLIEKPATKFFEPEQLRVFDELPVDAINVRIDESFVPRALPAAKVLETTSEEQAIARWQKDLKEKVFRNWPTPSAIPVLEMLDFKNGSSASLTTYGLKTDEYTHLPIFRIQSRDRKARKKKRIIILDDDNWRSWAGQLAAIFPDAYFWSDVTPSAGQNEKLEEVLASAGDVFLVSVRGAGPARFSGDSRKQTHIRRRYYLLGQTLHSMQTWDILQAIRSVTGERGFLKTTPVTASADGTSAGMLLYASLFVEKELFLDLSNVPKSHAEGPYYLGVMRYLDLPAAMVLSGAP